MAWIEELVAANEVYVAERKNGNLYPRPGERRSKGAMRDRAHHRAMRNMQERKRALGVKSWR